MDQTIRDIAVTEVVAEFHRAADKHPRFNSAHEGFAVILEEVDELKAEVWKGGSVPRDRDAMRKEAVQVAAMALRFVTDVCSEKKRDVIRIDYHGNVSYYMLGHVDEAHFRKSVMASWWSDLIFSGLGPTWQVWMIRKFAHEHLLVPKGTPGSFEATWAEREDL